MDVSVVVATYGSQDWARLALERAVPSAAAQAPTIHVHGENLAASRNEGLAQVETEWVIHLDADDELTLGYVEAMGRGSADLRAPAVSYQRRHHPEARRAGMPNVAGHRHACSGECLPHGNWIVIGAAVRTELLRSVGGWEDWPLYEDWAAWLRCWLAGATVEAVPDAVYRAHVRDNSRNRAPSIDFKNQVHHQIVAACMPVAA